MSGPKQILHMLTPDKHVSPFDVNQALDAGYDAVTPYERVTLEEVPDLVQDVIFSRPPEAGTASALFFGGNDAVEALDMLAAADDALVPPFAVNRMADPAGSFTTAAALVAKVEALLKTRKDRDLKDAAVAIFGATGVVGYSAAVIAAGEGAKVTLVGHDGLERVRKRAEEMRDRFGVEVTPADGSDETGKNAILAGTEVVLAAAKAGIQVVSADDLARAERLLVAADVNAVPPPGIAGLDVMADGEAIEATNALGIGALAVGQVKSKTEYGLLRRMIESEEARSLDFRDAFELARTLVG